MEISVSSVQGKVPVGVIALDGRLDGQNYQELIAKAGELYQAGTRNILLDLSKLVYISSAGIVALHTIALMLRGEAVPDPEQGWAAVKAADRTRESGVQQHLKLFNPQPEVASVLDMVGFTAYFEIFTDRDKAIAAF
ncbi:MAG TPA: STAS domain-containing protein [Anaerolineales bacterium]|nr:STAS domain-containing protein [Anaerolineales bacterium]